MRTHRPRLLVSSLLLLTAFGGFVLGTLSRPEPAGAATSRSRRFVFSPLPVLSNQDIECYYFNSGTRPTPPATLDFVDRFGALVAHEEQPPVAPGQAGGAAYINEGANPQVVAVILTFAAPAAGQAVPDPLPANAVVFGGQTLLGVTGPAR